MKFDLKKINFRKHKKSDIDWRIKWLNDEKINKFVLDDSTKKTNEAEQKKWFDDYEKNTSKEFFTILYEKSPIGLIGLSKINKRLKSANLFIMIGEKKFHGRGIGYISSQFIMNYVFEKLKLKRIDLEVDRNNLSAIKLYKNLGFKENKKLSNKKEIAMFLLKN